MTHRIEIASLGSNTVDIYTIDKTLNHSAIKKIAAALINPVVQKFSIDKPISTAKYSIEIGFLPGVTDNIGNTCQELIENLLKIKFRNSEKVYYSKRINYQKNISTESLYNPLIQRVYINDFKTHVPKVKLSQNQKVTTVNLSISDEELKILGKKGINGPLALDLTYMKAIQKYFKDRNRNPTDIELESIAQTWSEHCKHTIFNDPIDDIKNGLFKTYIKKATEEIRKKKGGYDICASVFEDNSGAIIFDKKYLITHKVETHNSPSALDPFGGAITGICGVNRDAIGFGLGAKPIVNTYGFCFAEPNIKTPLFRDEKLTQKILSPRRIIDGVIAGVNSGGNCSGIPTPQGFIYFDKNYRGKPLVFVGTIGLIPKTKVHKQAKPNDLIVMVGGRVGLDGIHGATFSSEGLDSGSPATAVQIGDPITQKKLSDALVKEARDKNLYNSITDNGAGGLSCSVAEMAKESNGAEVYLERVPLKYPGLSPWQIWISESQERMTLAVPPKNWQKLFKLLKKRGVEATVIGKFTNSKKCIVKYNNKTVMNIDMNFLHNGLPPRPMITKKPTNFQPIQKKQKSILEILSSLNIASYEFISQQYDHEVQGTSVLKPLQGKGLINAEAVAIKPVLSSNKGIIISQALYPDYSEIDPYYMAASCIDTAIRNIVAAGGNIENIVLLDNFCWCSSNDSERLYQLKMAAKACYDYATGFETPFISGKDSMFNDFKGFDKNGNPIKISIPPTLLISSLGVVDDIKKTISIDLKFPGDLLYLLESKDKDKKTYKDYFKAVQKELIVSAIPVNRGGIGIALAKAAMADMLGIEVIYNGDLYAEKMGRIIVSINPKNANQFEKIMSGNAIKKIGVVTNNNLIKINNTNIQLAEAIGAYKKTFQKY